MVGWPTRGWIDALLRNLQCSYIVHNTRVDAMNCHGKLGGIQMRSERFRNRFNPQESTGHALMGGPGDQKLKGLNHLETKEY